MPFLRAALINKQEPKPEQENPDVIVNLDNEPENLELEESEQEIDVENLHRIIDEKVDELEQESQEPEEISELEPEIEPETFTPQYDFTSGERYVDKISTKTDFDKMLDSLGAISKDLLSWEVEKFAKKYTDKFQGNFDKAEADAKKYEAFLGGYITNAAMLLYDNGYMDLAVKQLEQAKSIIEARRKLEVETQAIKDRVEEENAAVDLSDILGLFGDG